MNQQNSGKSNENDASINRIVLASKYDRLRAALIDYVIFFILFSYNYSQLFEVMNSSRAETEGSKAFNIFFLSFLPLLFINMYLWAKNGQSIGKKLIGIKIVHQSGRYASISSLFFNRNLLFILFHWTIILPVIDFIYMYKTKDQQCLHDLMAETIVIKA